MSYRTRGQSSGRIVAADAALVITDNDGVGSGVILLAGSTTGTKAATFSWNAPSDALGGAALTLFLEVRSGGSYTVACTYLAAAGTVTLDAALERPTFQRLAGVLYCTGLGGATFA